MNLALMVSLGIGMGILVAALGIALQGRGESAAMRISRYMPDAVTVEEMELRLPMTERIVIPIFRRIATLLYHMTPVSQIAATRRYLVMAGHYGGVAVIEFIIQRIVVAIIFGAGTALLLGLARQPVMMIGIFTALMMLLGYLLPSMALGSRVRERQDTIQRSLPDALDLLTVCVEAGSGFDAAISRLVSKWRGPLADEFSRLLADLNMGRGRREALRDMGERTGVLDVQAFAAALIQADQLGVGLVSVLRVQADQMRMRRRQRAEEQAQKAPIKMLFPLVFLMLPALYIAILGPAVSTLMGAFSGG